MYPSEESPLASLRAALATSGFYVLRSVVSEEECDRFLKEQVLKAVEKHTDYREGYPETYAGTDGTMVHNGGKDPIEGEEGRWPALMDNEKLNDIISQLHGGSGQWDWLHSDNVGWIHIRFPTRSEGYASSEANLLDLGWHVDGGHFKFHKYHSPEQSVIILPMVRDVQAMGGATKILKGSQVEVGNYLACCGRSGVEMRLLNEYCQYFIARKIVRLEPDRVVAAEAKKGDVLIMHPHVVHASCFNTIGSPWRITFNMGTRFTSRLNTLSFPSDRKLPMVDEAVVVRYGEPISLEFSAARGLRWNVGDGGRVSLEKFRASAEDGRDYQRQARFRFFLEKAGETGRLGSVGDAVLHGDMVNIVHRNFEGEAKGIAVGRKDGKLRVLSETGEKAEGGEEDEKQGIFVLQTLPSLPPSPVLTGDRPTLFLLDWKSGRHVNCGEASAAGEEKGAVECRWTDQGEWQEVILSKT